jgi:hypothetical protein
VAEVVSMPTRSRPTPLHKLDTVLFFTSYQQQLHSNLFSVPASIFGGGAPDSIGAGSSEYRVISSQPAPAVSSASKSTDKKSTVEQPNTAVPVFSLADITDGINGDLLRTIFLVCDVLILVYRMTLTCWTVRALRRRFSTRCRCGGGAGQLSRHRIGGGCSESSSVVRFAGGAVDGAVSGEMTSSSFRSDAAAVPHPDYRLQPFCQGYVTNIYTDPQTLAVQNNGGSIVRTAHGSVNSLPRTGYLNSAKRNGK